MFDSTGYQKLKDRVELLLDLVERPVGTLKARIPQTEESERAIVALFDAIGRTR